jgi:hypothetical protein
MKNLVVSELERVWSRGKTKGVLVLFIVVTILWGVFMKQSNMGFYDPETIMKLNSLNLGVFIVRDIHPLLVFVILPMLYVDGFNGEYSLGYYRNVMIRPYEKLQFMVSKIIAQIIVTFIVVFIMFILTSILGEVYFDKVYSTEFFKVSGSFSFVGALIYRAKFYFVEFVILVSVLSLSTLICSIIPNIVLAFMSIIGFFIGGIYVLGDNFFFFLSSGKDIFDVLGNVQSYNFYIIILSFIIVGITSTLILWKKRDFLY